MAAGSGDEAGLGGLRGYVWTLYPYFLGALSVLMVALLACPCCLGFLIVARSKRRPPFPQTPGVGFHICFALIGLVLVLTALAALEGEARAGRAYARAKCGAFVALDVLANGNAPAFVSDSLAQEAGLARLEAIPPGGGAPFVGFRPLAEASNATFATFPEVLEQLDGAEEDMPNSTAKDSFNVQASEFIRQWSHEHRLRMEVTQYDCEPCSLESLSPLKSALARCRNSSDYLQGVFDHTRRFVRQVAPVVKRMRNGTLHDAVAVYRAAKAYSSMLSDLIAKWDQFWQPLSQALHGLVLASLASLALGVVSLTACSGEGLPLFAWWFAYLVSLALLLASAALLPSAVATRDAAGLLGSALSSREALKTYDATPPLEDLSSRQFEALALCVAPPQGGDHLRSILNITPGPEEAEAAERLLRALRGVGGAKLESGEAEEAFFKKYENLGGEAYTAKWNSSQTLGPDGLAEIAAALKHMSLEHWAFWGQKAPPGCPLARNFDPNVDVMTSNCWFVTEVRPSSEEVNERYITLSPAQMLTLQTAFARARASAEALNSMYSVSNEAPKVHRSWQSSVQSVNTALKITAGLVAVPARAAAANILLAANATDCTAARQAYLLGAQALGEDLVRAEVFLWACASVLAGCNLGLAVLYCLLWGLRQPGATHKPRFPGQAGGAGRRSQLAAASPSGPAAPGGYGTYGYGHGPPSPGAEGARTPYEDEDEAYYAATDDEVELQRPLKSSWRR